MAQQKLPRDADGRPLLYAKSDTVSPFWIAKFEKDARKYWDIFYKNNREKFFKDRHYLGNEFAELKPSKSKRVLLEVGCGVGNTVYPLLEQDPNLFIYCCDFSERAVQLVKDHPSYDETRVKAFVCDITSEPIADHIDVGSVDVVTLIFVLSAISPEKMGPTLQNIASVMKPSKGRALFRDYADGDLAQERLVLKDEPRKISESFYVRADGTRCYYFEDGVLADLFRDHGFGKLKMHVVERQVENKKKDIVMNRRWIQANFSTPSTCPPPLEAPPPPPPPASTKPEPGVWAPPAEGAPPPPAGTGGTPTRRASGGTGTPPRGLGHGQALPDRRNSQDGSVAESANSTTTSPVAAVAFGSTIPGGGGRTPSRGSSFVATGESPTGAGRAPGGGAGAVAEGGAAAAAAAGGGGAAGRSPGDGGGGKVVRKPALPAEARGVLAGGLGTPRNSFAEGYGPGLPSGLQQLQANGGGPPWGAAAPAELRARLAALRRGYEEVVSLEEAVARELAALGSMSTSRGARGGGGGPGRGLGLGVGSISGGAGGGRWPQGGRMMTMSLIPSHVPLGAAVALACVASGVTALVVRRMGSS